MCASPKVIDTTLAPRRCCLPGHHPLNKEESEVWWSHHRSWSDTSGQDRLGSQNSYPHASLELQQRRPPCARESWCLMVRLPPWQDVSAEDLAPDRLNSVLSLSSHPQARPFYRDGSSLPSAAFQIFLQKVDIYPPAWVGQTRTLLAGRRGHCPQRHPCSSSVGMLG